MKKTTKENTKEMIDLFKKIGKKYNLKLQKEKFSTEKSATDHTIIKVECYKLFDKTIETKSDKLYNQINKYEILDLYGSPCVNSIVLTYNIENGIGDAEFLFPDGLNCGNVFDEKYCNKIKSESSFDKLYKKHKKEFEDYCQKYEYEIKQAIVQNRLEKIESMFNPNYIKKRPDDFFTKLANM